MCKHSDLVPSEFWFPQYYEVITLEELSTNAVSKLMNFIPLEW